MKINFTQTVHGNPQGKILFIMTPVEDAEEPFCWNSPFFIKAKDENDAIKEARKLLNDGTFSGITRNRIEQNNHFTELGIIED